jgi:hypothetical protein
MIAAGRTYLKHKNKMREDVMRAATEPRSISRTIGNYTTWIATALILAVAASAAAMPSFANAYDQCHGKVSPWNEHCYALAEWRTGPHETEVSGSHISILTSQQAVPGGKAGEEAFVTNEMWNGFFNGGWVESGQISDSSTQGKGLRFFIASDVEGKALYKTEFSNGPADNTWNSYTMQNAGSGIWYFYINSGGPWGYGGQPGALVSIEDGLEMTQTNIENNGSSTGAKHLSVGKWWEGFEGETGMAKYVTDGYNGDGEYTHEAPTCVYQSEAWAGDAAFGSQPCPPGALFGEVAEAPQSSTRPGTTGTVAGGAAISLAQVEAIALRKAQDEGDAAPTGMTVVRTTRGDGLKATQNGFQVPSETAVQPWLNSEAFVVEINGSFSAGDQPVPAGTAGQRGTVLGLVIDAHTGEVTGTSITSTKIPMASLGTVTRLGG